MIDWRSYERGVEDAAMVCLRATRDGKATLEGAIFSSAVMAYLAGLRVGGEQAKDFRYELPPDRDRPLVPVPPSYPL